MLLMKVSVLILKENKNKYKQNTLQNKTIVTSSMYIYILN